MATRRVRVYNEAEMEELKRMKETFGNLYRDVRKEHEQIQRNRERALSTAALKASKGRISEHEEISDETSDEPEDTSGQKEITPGEVKALVEESEAVKLFLGHAMGKLSDALLPKKESCPNGSSCTDITPSHVAAYACKAFLTQ
jgi:hypothetical protein